MVLGCELETLLYPVLILLLPLLTAGCGLFDSKNQDSEADPCSHLSAGEWVSLGLDDEDITAIAIHPDDPGILYAGTWIHPVTGSRLFKSIDCGALWEILAPEGIRSLHLDPADPDVIYAVTRGLHRSMDGGSSWVALHGGIMDPNQFAGVSSLAIHPENPGVLYAGTSGPYGGGLYKTTDGGENWEMPGGDTPEYDRFRSGVVALAIDPGNPETVYAGTSMNGDVLRSLDGGDTWEVTGLADTGRIVNFLKIFKNPDIIYAGIRFQGVYVAADNPYMDQWTKIILPDSITGVTGVVAIPERNSVLYATIRGILKDDGTGELISYNEGLSNTYISTIVRGQQSKILFAGLRKPDGKPGGIYARSY